MLRQVGLRARPASILARPSLALARPALRQYSEVKPPNVPTSSGQPVAPNAAPNAAPKVQLDGKTEAKLEKKLGRLERYAPALAQLSQRTGVSLQALTGAFLVLHEATAVVPVFLIYWLLHFFGVGAGLVAWLADVNTASSSASSSSSSVPVDHESSQGAGGVTNETHEWKQLVHEWYEEGARKVERVGRRYGWLGYEKGSKPGQEPDAHAEQIVTKDAGAVADAIAAYVIVKVSRPFLPPRRDLLV